jgi:MYXO-CTERM domain-containing protein
MAVEMGGCSGTLLDPEIVVFAAHCAAASEVYFGPDVSAPDVGFFVPTTECVRLEGGGAFGAGDDFQWCRLAVPQFDVPIVPPLMGCETDVLAAGVAVTIVGYGRTETGLEGRKHEVTTEILALVGPEVQIGGMGADSCEGDSGGPVFVALPEGGGVRVFGVTSYGSTDCMSGGFYSLLSNGMPWLEQSTGLDLTPCTDALGTWDPDPRCVAVVADPAADEGTWSTACSGRAEIGPLATCGPAFAADPDETVPVVAIVAPLDGADAVADPSSGAATWAFAVEASDEGWGLQRIELWRDGDVISLATAREGSLQAEVDLPIGEHTVYAEAVDLAGLRARSAAVHLAVRADRDDEAGCTCSATAAPARAWWGLLLVVLTPPRRRGRSRGSAPATARPR